MTSLARSDKQADRIQFQWINVILDGLCRCTFREKKIRVYTKMYILKIGGEGGCTGKLDLN